MGLKAAELRSLTEGIEKYGPGLVPGPRRAMVEPGSIMCVRDSGYACFHCHQVAEKSLKACFHSRGLYDTRGRSILALLVRVAAHNSPFRRFGSAAERLDGSTSRPVTTTGAARRAAMFPPVPTPPRRRMPPWRPLRLSSTTPARTCQPVLPNGARQPSAAPGRPAEKSQQTGAPTPVCRRVAHSCAYPAAISPNGAVRRCCRINLACFPSA